MALGLANNKAHILIFQEGAASIWGGLFFHIWARKTIFAVTMDNISSYIQSLLMRTPVPFKEDCSPFKWDERKVKNGDETKS